MPQAIDAILTEIAQKTCLVPTLETRKAGDLDMHEIAVWSLKKALEQAYEAGQQASKGTARKKPRL